MLKGQSEKRKAIFSSPILYYGENNVWECKKPSFAKVRVSRDKVPQDDAKGTILVENENEQDPKRKFCLETGGKEHDEYDKMKGDIVYK